MRRHAATLRAVLLACLLVTAGCSFLAPNPDSYTSTYYYSVGIDADATVENATLRLPLPQQGGAASFNASTVAPDGTVEEAFDATVVATDRGPMLELTADAFTVETRYYRVVESDGVGRREEIDRATYDPANPDHQRVDHRSVGVSVDRTAPYPIETRAPLEDGPLLYDDGVVTRGLADCELPRQDATSCFAYDAPLYLSYETAANGTVAGSVFFEGTNEWFAGGWTGNGYVDRVEFNATGPQDGWVTGEGRTETGRGTYPSPER
jgi:hypothetical protein